MKQQVGCVDIQAIQQYLRKFLEDRGWDKVGTPKNLSMALSVEVAELVELFQWDDNSSSEKVQEDEEWMGRIREEVADVFIYLIRLCDVLNIDLEEACWDKTKLNAKKHSLPSKRD